MDTDHHKLVKELLARALEKPDAAERVAYLEQACDGDEELRREVEGLLQTQCITVIVAGKPGAGPSGSAPEPGPARSSLVGERLGLYEVEELIGAGGMGEVYRARDQRLRRAVALKVLPAESSLDPERLARLEREARMLAALNHPNIAAIHGLEESAGKRFLVLEMVEGETLAERLARGRIAPSETLYLCAQIAEGLEAAHEKGIVHRDLKPANIKITPEGKVKVLDFGLAKEFLEEGVPADPARSSTLTKQMNPPGIVFGTAPYMSPEQAQGQPIDKRADIWAFGCVLYECLAGKKAFPGETLTEVFAAILTRDPDWEALPAATPGKVKDLLHRCVQKEPKERLHDIADARIELEEQMATPHWPQRAWPRVRLGWLIAVGMITLVLGLLIGAAVMKHSGLGTPGMAQPVVRSLVKLEPGQWLEGRRFSAPSGFDHPTRTAMALSSDGRFIVFSAVRANPGTQDKSCLYLRRFDQLEAKPIAGTEGGISPFLSPDDRWVGFWADGKLMKVSVDGGVPTELCNVPSPFGFSWGGDNQIIFARDSGLSRISAAGGKVEVLTTPDKSEGEVSHRLPCCLPAGRGILFTIMRQYWDPHPCVAVLDLATRKWRVLLKDGADARQVATGHLAFLRRGTLMVIPFDQGRMDVTGQPVPAITHVEQALNINNSGYDTSAGQFSISASGLLVYAPGGILPDPQNSIVWLNRLGMAETIPGLERGPFFSPRLSPDGQRIAYATQGTKMNAWVFDLNRSMPTMLPSKGFVHRVIWTPNGQRLTFGWINTGAENIYWQPIDGSSPMERLTESDLTQSPGSWSPDGETLAFAESPPETGYHIYFLNVRDRSVTPYPNSGSSGAYPEFSPDGRWMAYVSGTSTNAQVYVRPFPAGGSRWQVSSDGGTEPLWSRTGKELFYRHTVPGSRTNQVWSVDVQTGSGFSPGKPRLLFEQQGYDDVGPNRNWDVSPDGERFLMVKIEARKSEPLTEMVLVQNWFEEVRRLAPTHK